MLGLGLEGKLDTIVKHICDLCYNFMTPIFNTCSVYFLFLPSDFVLSNERENGSYSQA